MLPESSRMKSRLGLTGVPKETSRGSWAMSVNPAWARGDARPTAAKAVRETAQALGMRWRKDFMGVSLAGESSRVFN
jgi:hypothetical protein